LRKALLFLQQLHTFKGIYEGQNVVKDDGDDRIKRREKDSVKKRTREETGKYCT
jgi:hypothetical protein